MVKCHSPSLFRNFALIISIIRIKKHKKTDVPKGIAVFRQNPMKRSIIFDSDWDDVPREQFFLSFPYVFFAIKYIIRKRKNKNNNKMTTTYRPTKLYACFSTDAELKSPFEAALPNIHDDNSVCIDLPYKNYSSIKELVNEVVKCFWTTAFDPEELNSQYEDFDDDPKIKTLSDYKLWAKKTKQKPNWIPTAPEMLEIENLDSVFDFKKK